MVGKLTRLTAEQSLEPHRLARIRVDHDIGEQWQGVDDLDPRDGGEREPDLTADQEVFADLDHDGVGTGDEDGGRSGRAVMYPAGSDEHQPIVRAENGKAQFDQALPVA